MSETIRRFSLRDLPFPAKLVVSCFLLAVGGGYSAAMVQLHMQDSRTGQAMPTVHDVILKYTGKKWFEAEPERPQSKFVKLITAPMSAPFNGSGTMQPAFTTSDDGEFMRVSRASADQRDKLQPQRDGERDALVLWAELPAEERRAAFLDNHFAIKDPARKPKDITPKFQGADGAIKVKSIIESRCTRCHMTNGDDPKAAAFPLETYEQIEKYLSLPTTGHFRAGGDWVRIEEPIGLEKLTQTTHAHLLSFAMLFSLTGLVFAFTSYPAVLRCVLGPWVLLAVVADVSLWWLARLCDEWGPYFAMGIIGTGGAAGLGLAFQIMLSLFNMYGIKGKLILLLLFALAAAGAGLVITNKIAPGLKEKQERLAKGESEKKDSTKKEPDKKETEKKVPPKKDGNSGNGATSQRSAFQRVLLFPVKGPDGNEFPVLSIPFPKEDDGGMVRAFFDKDGDIFAKAVKDKDADEQKRLLPERHGELAALVAWSKLADPERKKAFEADAFELPAELAKKPVTGDYIKDGKVKVKSIISDRCIRCHKDEEKVPFSDYASLMEYLK